MVVFIIHVNGAQWVGEGDRLIEQRAPAPPSRQLTHSQAVSLSLSLSLSVRPPPPRLSVCSRSDVARLQSVVSPRHYNCGNDRRASRLWKYVCRVFAKNFRSWRKRTRATRCIKERLRRTELVKVRTLTHCRSVQFISVQLVQYERGFTPIALYTMLDAECNKQATVVSRLLTPTPSVVNNIPTTVACWWTRRLWTRRGEIFLVQNLGKVPNKNTANFGDNRISLQLQHNSCAKNELDLFRRFDTIPACDTHTHDHSICIRCNSTIALRSKNKV